MTGRRRSRLLPAHATLGVSRISKWKIHAVKGNRQSEVQTSRESQKVDFVWSFMAVRAVEWPFREMIRFVDQSSQKQSHRETYVYGKEAARPNIIFVQKSPIIYVAFSTTETRYRLHLGGSWVHRLCQNSAPEKLSLLESIPSNSLCQIFRHRSAEELANLARTSKSLKYPLELLLRSELREKECLELMMDTVRRLLGKKIKKDTGIRSRSRYLFGLLLIHSKLAIYIADWQIDQMKYIGLKSDPTCSLTIWRSIQSWNWKFSMLSVPRTMDLH